MRDETVAVVGAGPAGLCAAYLLARRQFAVTLFDADPDAVGGAARTGRFHNAHFPVTISDFPPAADEVETLWEALLPGGLVARAWPTPRGSGLTRLVAPRPPRVLHTPRLGAGQMWQTVADKARALGVVVRLGRTPTECRLDPDSELWTLTHQGSDGRAEQTTAHHLVWAAPLRGLVRGLTPFPSPDALRRAEELVCADLVAAALIVRDFGLLLPPWTEVADDAVGAVRVHSARAWSADMVPDPELNCLVAEYHAVGAGDPTAKATDVMLLERAAREAAHLGLTKRRHVVDCCVVRVAEALPQGGDEAARVARTIRAELERNYPWLHVVGLGRHTPFDLRDQTASAMRAADRIAGRPKCRGRDAVAERLSPVGCGSGATDFRDEI